MAGTPVAGRSNLPSGTSKSSKLAQGEMGREGFSRKMGKTRERGSYEEERRVVATVIGSGSGFNK